MALWRWAVCLAVAAPVATASFGNCDSSGANCDWTAYWLDIWTNGIWAWSIAGIILGCLLLYLLLKCCCCCCIFLVKCCWKATTCCCKNRVVSNTLIWTVRIVVLGTFALGLAGFILAAIGWGKVNDAVKYFENDYDQWVKTELQNQTNLTISTLFTANSNLTTVGQLTSQAALLNVLTSAQISAASSSQQVMAATWTWWRSTYMDNAQLAWNWLFWIAVVVPLAVLVGILVLGLVVRCGHILPFFLTVIGGFAAILVWAALGVASVGYVVIDDYCTSTAGIAANSSYGAGILTKMQCNPTPGSNQFTATRDAYNQASAAAISGACGSVRPQCNAGRMSCPTVPGTCSSLSEVAPLGTEVTVVSSAANGGCSNSCTAQQCASTCTGATLINASQGLVLSIQTAVALNESNTTVLTPLLTCANLINNFVVDVNTKCSDARQGANNVKLGMLLLGIAALIGMVITTFLSHWFEPTDRKDGDDNDGRGPNDLDAAQRQEDMYQANLHSYPAGPYSDAANVHGEMPIYHTPAPTPK